MAKILTKEEALTYIGGMKDDVILEVTKKTTKSVRSLAQNRYYFGIIIQTISDYHGYNEVESHELIKAMFKVETTTGLDIEEFMWLVKQIREIWQEKFNCYIPEPSDRFLFNN